MKFKLLIREYLGSHQGDGPNYGKTKVVGTFESDKTLMQLKREIAEKLGIKIRPVGRPKKIVEPYPPTKSEGDVFNVEVRTHYEFPDDEEDHPKKEEEEE